MADNNFKQDYRIAWLSIFGTIGFLFGCVVLFYPNISFKKSSNFHEVIYLPRSSAEKVITKEIIILSDGINKRQDTIIKNQTITVDSAKTNPTLAVSKKEENIKLNKLNDADSIVKAKLLEYQNLYDNASTEDTFSFSTLNNALHYQITQDTVNNWDSSFKIHGTLWRGYAKYYFKDPKIPNKLEGTDTFEIKPYQSDISFITKYPATGSWIILILIFCSFSLISILTCINLKKKVDTLFSDNSIYGLYIHAYYITCVVVFVVLMILILFWNLTFFDDTIVKNLYFFDFENSMRWIVATGWIAGTFCLAGFIYTSSSLSYFVKKIKNKAKEISQNQILLNSQPKTAAEKFQLQSNIDTGQNENDKNIILFNSLYQTFNTYFILSAIILSLLTLCTGAFFSTVNSLDFIKLLSNDWGFSPVRSDFIYLYAGLYTVILLLVYIPAKMRFNEITLLEKIPNQEQQGDNKWYSFLQNPFAQLKDILVAASPLLAGLIQSLFSLLFNR